jgi:hypothetical protein
LGDDRVEKANQVPFLKSCNPDNVMDTKKPALVAVVAEHFRKPCGQREGLSPSTARFPSRFTNVIPVQ